MDLAAYGNSHKLVVGVFRHTFAGISVHISFSVGGGYLQSRSYVRTPASGITSVLHPSATKLLNVFHSLCVVNMSMSREGSVEGPGGGKLFMYQTGNRIVFVVKTVPQGHSSLTRSVSLGTTWTALGGIGNTMPPYVLYNHSDGTFAVLES